MMAFPNYSYNFSKNRYNYYHENYKKPPKKIEEPPKKEIPKNDNIPMFEIMGISLYFDDILLICLLFFLFEEGIDDQWLYIAIILLLLS